MIRISVKSDISKAMAKLANVRKEVMEKAVPRALNKVATEVKAEAARSIKSAGYGLKVGIIKKQIDIQRATRNDPQVILTATGRPIPLINYGARPTDRGVSVNVKNGRKLILHAFIATMPTGHVGVYVRKGKGHKLVERNGKLMWSGLPLRELFGPSIPTAFSSQVVQSALERKIKERFPKLMEREIAFLSLK